ncbi:MAG TPA: LCP family protein [Glaciibacter sp.]|nr:LCP family protein [Glaciibacter sp.]
MVDPDPNRLPLARHGRLRSSRAVTTVVKALAIAVAVFLVSGVTVAGVAVWSVTGSLRPSVSLPNDSKPGEAPVIGAIEGGVNLLLVGSDSGEGDPAYGERYANLNDVNILLHIAEDHRSATVVSFPRDLYVEIPACPASADGTASGTSGGFSDKINTALGHGGLGCVVATVENLTGLTIPFAAQIEFNGVIEMSNAVGGVPVCVAEDIEDLYTRTRLAAGEHLLSGVDALQFLRTRHGLQNGSDLARISNQQVFLSSLVRTIKSDGTLGDPLKLYSLAKAAADNMILSDQLQSLDTMVSIALALRDIDLGNVAFVQYPIVWVDGGIMPLEADAAVLVDALARDVPVALSGQLGESSAAIPNPAPSASPTSTPTGSPSTPAAPTDSPTPAPTPGTPTVALPPSVTGQTAAQQTCSVGRTLAEQ